MADLTKEKIIQQARMLFIELGYEKVSMRGIAKDLGCSHGALYYHFKNKTALFSRVLDFYFQELNSIIDTIMEQTENDRVQELFLGFIRFGLDHPHQYELMFMLKSEEMDSLMQRAATESFERFEAAVKEAGNINPQNGEIYSIFLALHGFVSLHLHRAENFEAVAKAAKRYVTFLRKTI
ncbi:WHG domain-containing protein [Terribacillus halophilus]|uniref:WHG domain-containing protein n=1 Tax=Terribacillus halophilus TaxID=361279 RepID=A0A1G6QPZ8_9BACI|nr:TetR/AcrR family transcriptional regulator [Terribacillus halophilus]SDC94482.1 WHG domain-containing protein [Terribacillus halophilus]